MFFFFLKILWRRPKYRWRCSKHALCLPKICITDLNVRDPIFLVFAFVLHYIQWQWNLFLEWPSIQTFFHLGEHDQDPRYHCIFSVYLQRIHIKKCPLFNIHYQLFPKLFQINDHSEHYTVTGTLYCLLQSLDCTIQCSLPPSKHVFYKNFTKIYLKTGISTVCSSVGRILGYLNIFRQIYSFVSIFVDFFQRKYIWIFIRDLFILTNIFGYSFVQYLW